MNDEYFAVPEAQKPEPEPRTREFSSWWAWAAIGSTLAVASLFLLMQWTFQLNDFALSQFATARPPSTRWLTAMTSTRTSWATALFVATIIMVVLAVASIRSIRRSKPPRWLVVSLCLFQPLGFALVVGCPWLILPPLPLEGGTLVANATHFDPTPRLVVFLAGLYATAILLAAAVVLELRTLSAGVDLAHFRKVRLDIRNALTLTTLWLVVGVIGIALFHRMICLSLGPKPIAEVEQLANATTLLSGAFYSALLASLFGPAEAVLRWVAAGLAEDVPGETEELAVSVSQSLLKVLAIFGPLLAGLLSNVAEVIAK
jgi:hypothetical protein